MRRFFRHGQRGFTYVELLVTMGILLILAVIAIPVSNAQAARAKESTAKSALEQVQTEIDLLGIQSPTASFGDAVRASGYTSQGVVVSICKTNEGDAIYTVWGEKYALKAKYLGASGVVEYMDGNSGRITDENLRADANHWYPSKI